jgi:hypothetical protein
MLKCASVYTYEIDNKETALNEIKTRLNEKITLLENSIGIVMCHPEFIASGTLKYICENLPFETAGITTAALAVNEEVGELILTVFVITCDDCRFKTGIAENLDKDIDAPVKAALAGVAPPKLALIFPPLILKYSGDSYVNAFEKAVPGTPVFGGVSIDDTLTYDLSETIYNGENYATAMPFILCYGEINPRFIIGTFPDKKILPYKGEVTKSQGSVVFEINDINPLKYFKSIGLIKDGSLADNFNFFPFSINQRVIRGLAFFNQDGSAVFRGDVEEGSIFSILTCEFDDVLSVTKQKIEHLNDLTDVNGVIAFPCIARRMMVTHVNPLLELETVKDTINPEIPFSISYAGGEICPTLGNDDSVINSFHNYSLVILII